MRTTLNLDDKLLADLMRVTDAKTKTDAIQEAMAALVRRKKLDKLRSLSGRIRLRAPLENTGEVRTATPGPIEGTLAWSLLTRQSGNLFSTAPIPKKKQHWTF